jgi:hypothetical protein
MGMSFTFFFASCFFEPPFFGGMAKVEPPPVETPQAESFTQRGRSEVNLKSRRKKRGNGKGEKQ